MFQIVFAVHILICIAIIALVLIQQGKGADAGAIFGSSSDSVVGPGSAPSFFTKITTSLAIAFMCTSILLVKTYMNRTPITTQTETEDLSQDSLFKKVVPEGEVRLEEGEAAEATGEAVAQQADSQENAQEEAAENATSKEDS